MQSKKKCGVEGLIEIENPNRVSQKSKKVTELDITAPRELSRRERWVSVTKEKNLGVCVKSYSVLLIASGFLF